MNIYLECIHCLIRQTLELITRTDKSISAQKEMMREALAALSELDYSQSPPKMMHTIHRLIARKVGDFDPYQKEKEEMNRQALQLYPRLKSMVEESSHPWETGLRLAIAGNIIDLAAKNSVELEDIDKSIQESLTLPLPLKAAHHLKTAVDEADSILYLGDNAGEIVFDKLFIEQMPYEKICFAVRGKPILNDAVMKDAVDAGMTEMVEVIDNGTDVPGTILEECSPEFVRRFNQADLIISKGQGNYETLNQARNKIFHIFKVKCPIVAVDIGIEAGSLAVIWN